MNDADKLRLNETVDPAERARYLESEETFCPFCGCTPLIARSPRRTQECGAAVTMRLSCPYCTGEISEVFTRYEVELGWRGQNVDCKLRWSCFQSITMPPAADLERDLRARNYLREHIKRFDSILKLTCPLCGLEAGRPVQLTAKIDSRFIARTTARCETCHSAWIERFRLNDFQVETAPPVSLIVAAPHRKL